MFQRLLRVARKPPAYILERVWHELQMRVERVRAPRRAARFSASYLAQRHGFSSVDAWWNALGARRYLAHLSPVGPEYDVRCPGDRERILAAAARARAHRVDLLGSGEVELGERIDWHRDYKSGAAWPMGYCGDLRYGGADQHSDVKFPWELSRLQWMIPLGQAYLLTGDERYAATTRELLESWFAANPHAGSINWSCTMEVALRIISLSWFFHVFKDARAWESEAFRGTLLRAMYLHADFTARHLEKSDVNGNHYTADAAGLVYAGLFFGEASGGRAWLDLGWGILRDELPKQVYDDGVDFEASVPYHRLVQELFLLPALYRELHGGAIPEDYRARLVAMARYTAAYSRADGSVPLIGDADDARTLPFGGQGINDHRYLLGVAGVALADPELVARFSGPTSEIFWLLGPAVAGELEDHGEPPGHATSVAFPHGGYFVLRNREDHVFVSCAPLGLGGRGGHSHNDSLSLEAVLCGAHLISDCGAYVYTASYAERNLFRSTAYHNTPQVDGEEINRFISPDYLWGLHNDARPVVREVSFSTRLDRLVVSHTGYQRLASPVTPLRTVTLDHDMHRLAIHDRFEGDGQHLVEIPLHLAAGVEVVERSEGRVTLAANGNTFAVAWRSAGDWTLQVLEGRVSPSYGVTRPTSVLQWRRRGTLAELLLEVAPR